MNERRLDNLLSAYLDGELGEVEKQDCEQLLATNPDAMRRLAQLRDTSRTLRELPHVDSPPGLSSPVTSHLGDLETLSGPDAETGEFLLDVIHRPEQLVTAYRDGELTADQRSYVEEHLLTQPKLQRALSDEEATVQFLSELSQVKAPVDLARSAVSELRGGPAPGELQDDSAGESVSSKKPFAELLNAYLDDEIDDKRRQIVERKVLSSPKTKRALRMYEKTRETLEDLPQLSAPPHVVANVLDQLRREQSETVQPTVTTSQRSRPPHSRRRYSGVYRSAGLLAASVVLAWAVVELQLFRPESTAPTVVEAPASSNSVNDRTSTVAAAGAPSERSRPRSPENEQPTPVVRTVEPQPKLVIVPVDRNRLQEIKPGEVIKSLDEKQIRLVCVDVKRVYDRLRIVLLNNDVAVDLSLDQKTMNQRNLYVLDVAASPEQMSNILTEFQHAEEHGDQLVENVDISVPSKDMLANLQQAQQKVASKSRSETKGPIEVPVIELPQSALSRPANPKVEEALGAASPKTKPAPRREQAVVQKSSLPKPTSKADAKKHVRVLFVLEPKT